MLKGVSTVARVPFAKVSCVPGCFVVQDLVLKMLCVVIVVSLAELAHEALTNAMPK
jgi:hypothetical protein